jgi:TorA maturation chaperone TorD
MISSDAATAPNLAPEDEGRLQLYALLGRLFAAGPDDGLLELLAQSAGSIEGDGALARAFDALADAAAHTSAGDATAEFDATFIGVGKAPVTTYLSHYYATTRKEAVLVKLRGALTELGLARTAASAEPEDNLIAVLEVMRHLISAGSDDESLLRQRRFFSHYLEPAYRGFCGAARDTGLSDYYGAAVDMLEVFLDSEQAQFEMAALGNARVD